MPDDSNNILVRGFTTKQMEGIQKMLAPGQTQQDFCFAALLKASKQKVPEKNGRKA